MNTTGGTPARRIIMSAQFFGINGAQTFIAHILLPTGEKQWVKSDLTCTSWDNQHPEAGLSLYYIAKQILEDYPGAKVLAVETAGKL
jgi:hypothetical protein